MYFRIAIVVALFAATGLLHGRWTDRWGTSVDVAVAAERLPAIPLVLGDWDGRDITREESEVAYRSQSPQIVRRYVNRKTGAAVGVLVSCGRPSGMIIEHTPRTCYTELGYEESGNAQNGKVEGAEYQSHVFLKTTPAFTSRVRLLWCWGDGRTWSFPERPRIAFANQPVLYKMYVTREMLSDDEPLAEDPVLAFLKAATPELTAALAVGEK